MITAGELMSRKFHTVEDSMTVLEAAQQMAESKIGFVLVLGNDSLVGVFSERDCLNKVVAHRVDPGTLTVGQIMSKSVITISEKGTGLEAWKLMKDNHIRHLPVVDDNHSPVGVLGIRHVIDKLANDVTISEIFSRGR